MLAQLMDLALHGGVAAVILAALSWMFVKAPRQSLALVLILVVLEGSREWSVPLGASIGPIYVNWADVATALMGGIGLARCGWRQMRPPGKGALLGMTAMIGLGLVAWTLQLGLQPAVNFWRPWTFAMAAALYAASAPRLSAPDGLRPFVWAGMLASATQIIGIALHGFGSNMDDVIINGVAVSARPITASAALMMLVGLIVLLVDGQPLSARKSVLAAWLGTSIVVSEHRSVWVAAAVAGVLVLGALVRGSRQRLVAGTVAVIAGVAVATGVGAVVQSQQDLDVSAHSTGTFDWRVANWEEKLTTPRSALQWMVGSIASPTPLNDPATGVVYRVSSHSMYVEAITCLGVLGLGLLLLVIVGAIWSSLPGGATRIVVASAVAFGVFYQWPGFIWLVIGVALGLQSAPGLGLQRTPVRPARATGKPRVAGPRHGSASDRADLFG